MFNNIFFKKIIIAAALLFFREYHITAKAVLAGFYGKVLAVYH